MVIDRKLLPSEPNAPVSFGYKMSWITVRSQVIEEVVDSIGLVHPTPANWQEGIESAYVGKKVFVAPPINGWIAIVGFGTGDFTHPDPVSLSMRRIESASKRFQSSCSFATQRVIEYHHWMRAEDGRVTRCFAYLGERGETISNAGPVTSAERTLRFGNQPPDQWVPNEDDVMKIAGAWSYDPSKLNSSSYPATLGFIADWR